MNRHIPLRPISCRALLAALLLVASSALTLAVPHKKQTATTQTNVRPYQELWIPEAVSGKTFDLTLHKATRSFYKGANTNTYAYNNGNYWGPTLILNQGDNVQMSVKNELDEDTTAHWHGLHIPAAADGGPHQVIKAGTTWKTSFLVKNNAATYWYHPHAHGTTQKQITMGAGGFLIVKDPNEAKLALPRTYGVDDVPLALTSRRFYKNDQFSFEGDNDKYGDYLLTNGVLDAQTSLPAQFVRLRLLNVEVERGYIVGFNDDRTFYQIATDGGLIDRPLPLKRITLMPGERTEILVDLSTDRVGSSINLRAYNSNQPFGFPGGEPGTGRPNGSYLNNRDFNILHINIVPRTASAITKLPEQLTHNQFPTMQEVTARHTLHINGTPGQPFSFDNGGFKMDTVNQTVKLGATEAWTIVNNRVFGHAFHIHDIQFKIVSRSSGPVHDYEQGWKDTLYIFRDETVTFVAKFDDFASETHPYMYHCHMSNHEDEGLMGQFLVRTDPSAPLPVIGTEHASALLFRDQIEHPLTTAMELAVSRWSKQVAPDFATNDTSGRSFSLASLTKDRPLVLFFVEAGCPCSRDAAPFLDRIRAQYGDYVNVVGVIAAKQEVARAWVKQVGVQFPVIADPDKKIIAAYGAERAAYTTLVGPDGRIIKTYPGYGQEMLTEISNSIARLSNANWSPMEFETAPKRLVVGCPFALAQ